MTATAAPTRNAWAAPVTCQSRANGTKPARNMLSFLMTLFLAQDVGVVWDLPVSLPRRELMTRLNRLHSNR